MKAAAPGYLVLGVFVLVVFGGNGLKPATFVLSAQSHPASLGASVLIWSFFSFKFPKSLAQDPTLLALRAFPVDTSRLLVTLFGACCLWQMPWFFLWLLGADLPTAISTTLLSLVFALSWLPAPEQRANRLGASLLGLAYLALSSSALAAGSPLWRQSLFATASLALLVVTARRLWRHLPEIASNHSQVARRTSGGATTLQSQLVMGALAALTFNYGRCLLRAQLTRLVLLTAVFLLSGTLLGYQLTSSVQGESYTLRAALSLLGVSIALGSSTLWPPLFQQSQAAAALLLPSPIGARKERLARLLCGAGCIAMLSALSVACMHVLGYQLAAPSLCHLASLLWALCICGFTLCEASLASTHSSRNLLLTTLTNGALALVLAQLALPSALLITSVVSALCYLAGSRRPENTTSTAAKLT